MTILSPLIDAQSPDFYHRCYNVTTTLHCFKTPRRSLELLQPYDKAVEWCTDQGYSMVKIESTHVQSVVERFIEEYELTSDDVWTAAGRTAQDQWTWVNGNVFGNGSFLALITGNVVIVVVIMISSSSILIV